MHITTRLWGHPYLLFLRRKVLKRSVISMIRSVETSLKVGREIDAVEVFAIDNVI